MNGFVTGTPRLLLRLENLALMIVAIVFYALLHGSWWLFTILFLVPDISMVGYLHGPKVGAITYNIGHWYALPIIFVGCGFFTKAALLPIGLIWTAHIAFDRTLGFGLKHPGNFKISHLSASPLM